MGRVDLSIYLSVYLSVYLSIYPSVYLSIEHFFAIDGDGGGDGDDDDGGDDARLRGRAGRDLNTHHVPDLIDAGSGAPLIPPRLFAAPPRIAHHVLFGQEGPIDFANTGLPAGKAWPAHRALSLSGGKVAGSLNIAVAVK